MSIKLLDSLARQYLKKGFQIYGHLSGRPQAPENWEGPFPDMIAEKGSERIAFLGTPHNVCFEQFDRRRLDAALDNQGCSVHLLSTCINCTCGVDELVNALPGEKSHRVLVRRFASGKVMFPEISPVIIAGLKWKALFLLLFFIATGLAISWTYICINCA